MPRPSIKAPYLIMPTISGLRPGIYSAKMMPYHANIVAAALNWRGRN